MNCGHATGIIVEKCSQVLVIYIVKGNEANTISYYTVGFPENLQLCPKSDQASQMALMSVEICTCAFVLGRVLYHRAAWLTFLLQTFGCVSKI